MEKDIFKICRVCQQNKSLDNFLFGKGCKQNKRATCKQCTKNGLGYFSQIQKLKNDGLKKCSRCHTIKKLEEFYKQKSIEDKLISSCKLCWKDRNKQQRLDNLEQYKIRKKLFYQKNKEICSLRAKLRRQKNKHNLNKYRTIKRRTDLHCRLRDYLRSRLNKALKKNKKVGSHIESLGCSVEELKLFLEQKFYNNPNTNEKMTWDNYGLHGWHIDHIIPLSSFNLTNIQQMKIACHYTNLQPLWAYDNLSKGNKL